MVKNILCWFFLSLTSLTTVVASADPNGNGVGNGGDAVICKKSEYNPYHGYYSLDYVLQLNPNMMPAIVLNLKQSLQRIENHLREKLPELLPSFKVFAQDLFNGTDPTQKHYWEPAYFGLVDIKDEKITALIPHNCVFGGQMMIHQAIIRVHSSVSGMPNGKILFKYSPSVIEDLGTSSPLQLSFLIVHEWLWEFSDNVDRNRRVNYWFHSDQFFSLPRNKILKDLESVGFVIPTEADYSI